MTVWNEGDKEGTVNITYTGIPDNTNPNMTDWKTDGGNEVKKEVTIAPHESHTFRFFDIKNVTDDIKVTNAEPKQPN